MLHPAQLPVHLGERPAAGLGLRGGLFGFRFRPRQRVRLVRQPSALSRNTVAQLAGVLFLGVEPGRRLGKLIADRLHPQLQLALLGG